MILRLFFVFIFYFLFGTTRNTRWDSRWVNDGYGSNYAGADNDFLGINTAVSKAIRRFFSLRKCRKFVKKHGRIYTVANSNVSITFDSKQKEILCYSKKDISQKFTLCDYQLKENSSITLYNLPQDIFDECFDNICSAFDVSAAYAGIKEFYARYYTIDDEKEKADVKVVKEVKEPKVEGIMTVDEYFGKDIQSFQCVERLNVNTATEQQLADLPGINIVTAKKIIRYRELNNGFKSIEEFYKKMNIKKHFHDKLNGLIFVENTVPESAEKQDEDERIIDL